VPVVGFGVCGTTGSGFGCGVGTDTRTTSGCGAEGTDATGFDSVGVVTIGRGGTGVVTTCDSTRMLGAGSGTACLGCTDAAEVGVTADLNASGFDPSPDVMVIVPAFADELLRLRLRFRFIGASPSPNGAVRFD